MEPNHLTGTPILNAYNKKIHVPVTRLVLIAQEPTQCLHHTPQPHPWVIDKGDQLYFIVWWWIITDDDDNVTILQMYSLYSPCNCPKPLKIIPFEIQPMYLIASVLIPTVSCAFLDVDDPVEPGEWSFNSHWFSFLQQTHDNLKIEKDWLKSICFECVQNCEFGARKIDTIRYS